METDFLSNRQGILYFNVIMHRYAWIEHFCLQYIFAPFNVIMHEYAWIEHFSLELGTGCFSPNFKSLFSFLSAGERDKGSFCEMF